MIMGVSTFLVGVLPSSQTLGITAAVLLIILRCLQGLALGGESGGAAIFVAEYAATGKRGFYTSFVQMSAPSRASYSPWSSSSWSRPPSVRMPSGSGAGACPS